MPADENGPIVDGEVYALEDGDESRHFGDERFDGSMDRCGRGCGFGIGMRNGCTWELNMELKKRGREWKGL